MNKLITTNVDELNRAKEAVNKASALLLRTNVDRPFDFLLFLLYLRRSGPLPINGADVVFLVTQHPDAALLQPAMGVFLGKIEQLSVQVYESLVTVFNGLPEATLAHEFAIVFDYWWDKLFMDYRLGHMFYLTPRLMKLILHLADTPAKASIYHPFAAYDSFGTVCGQDAKYLAHEASARPCALATLRGLAHNNRGQREHLCVDALSAWPLGTFDLIVCAPPIFQPIALNTHSAHSIDEFVMRKGIESLGESGAFVLLVSAVFLQQKQNRPSATLLREWIDADLLDSVIVFYEGYTKQTQHPLVGLIAKKKKVHPGKVRFMQIRDLNAYGLYSSNSAVEASQVAESTLLEDAIRLVDTQTIQENTYSLNPMTYFLPQPKAVTLGSLMSPLKIPSATETAGKVLNYKHLKSDFVEYKLDTSSITHITFTKGRYKALHQSALLIGSIGNKIKTTYFEYTDTPIFLSSDIKVFKLNLNKVRLPYLIAELQEEYVQQQVLAFSFGRTIPRLTENELCSIRIQLPSKKQQHEILLERQTELVRREEKRLHLLRDSIELQKADQNGVLQHLIAGSVSNMRYSIEYLKQIFDQQIVPAMDGVLELKADPRHKLTLADYLRMLERDVKDVTRRINDHELVQRKYFVRVSLKDFLSQYVAEQANGDAKGYKIGLQWGSLADSPDTEPIQDFVVEADLGELRLVFDNLKDNAVKHAFISGEENEIELRVQPSADFAEVEIHFSNTGKPLADNFRMLNFFRNGLTSDRTTGSGYGGFLIGKIVDNIGGSIDAVNHTKQDRNAHFVTSFVLKIPIQEILFNL